MLRQQYAWTLAIVSVHVIGTLAMTLAGIGLVRTIATAR
jgi:fluoride exporter